MVPAQWLESIKASGQSSEKRGQRGGLLQFVDVAHECQSAAKTAATHVRVHQTFMQTLQELSRIMRKSGGGLPPMDIF